MGNAAVLVLLVVALAACGPPKPQDSGEHCEFNTYYFEQAMERQYGLDFDLDHKFSRVGLVETQGVSSPRHDVEIGFQVGVVKGVASGAVRKEDCRPVGPITLN